MEGITRRCRICGNERARRYIHNKKIQCSHQPASAV
jgi:hypothetical protein